MRSSHELRGQTFAVEIGWPPCLAGALPGPGEQDRLGRGGGPCAAVGASALVCATITAFYVTQRAASSPPS